jgi:hypothetical protein
VEEKKKLRTEVEGVSIEPQDQVPVMIRFGFFSGWTEKIVIRKGFEWEDFHFLVDSRLNDQEWEAWVGRHRWDMYDLSVTPNQEITMLQPDGRISQKREIQRRKEDEAWERVKHAGLGRLAFWREVTNDDSV